MPLESYPSPMSPIDSFDQAQIQRVHRRAEARRADPVHSGSATAPAGCIAALTQSVDPERRAAQRFRQPCAHAALSVLHVVTAMGRRGNWVGPSLCIRVSLRLPRSPSGTECALPRVVGAGPLLRVKQKRPDAPAGRSSSPVLDPELTSGVRFGTMHARWVDTVARPARPTRSSL
jgi:hypothetical protein